MMEKPEYMYYGEYRGPDHQGVMSSWRRTQMYTSPGWAKNAIKCYKRYPGFETRVIPMLVSSWLGEETCDKDLSV